MRISLFGMKLLFTRPIRNRSPGDDDANAPFFQDIVDRDPVLSSGLHADIQTVILMEPVGKVVQVRIKRREAFLLITGLQAILRSLNDGSHQK